MFKLSTSLRWVFFLQLFFCLCWGFAWYARIAPPQSNWLFAFLGLGYLFFVVLSMLLGLVWLLLKKAYFLLPFAMFYYTFQANQSLFNFSITTNTKHDGALSLMTYNVKNFDLYDWNKGPNTRAKMLQLLRNERPTLLCLQEFYSSDKKNRFNNEKYLADSLGYSNYVFNKLYIIDTTEAWGLAVYSRLPIINDSIIKFKNARINGAMYVDVVFELDTFRVFNVHLQSYHFGNKEYDVFENTATTKKRLKDAKSLFSKLKIALIARGLQVDILKDLTAASPYPCIVAGDFNDSPISYSYHQLSKKKQDAFVCKGTGFARTFSTKAFSYRIDHVLLDSIFKVQSYVVIEKKLSDHYPVMISFDF